MVKKGNGKYVCDFCQKEFTQAFDEDTHKTNEHHMIYVPIPERNLSQLYQALITGDFSKVDTNFLIYLQRFVKNVALNNMRKDKE